MVYQVSDLLDYQYLELYIKYGIDLKHRRIYIHNLDEDVVFYENHEWMAVKAIHFFNEISDESIEMYIDYSGGDVSTMFTVYDSIRQSKAPIHTIASGQVCSAGVLLLVCGHNRFSLENAWLMHHLSRVESLGDEREIAAQAKVNKRMSDRTYQLLSKHSCVSAKLWEKWARSEGEVWLNAEEMLEHGIIDEIIPSPKGKRPKRRRKNGNKDKPNKKK